MRKIILSVIAVLVLTGMVFSQESMWVVPNSELIDKGPVKDDWKFPAMKTDPNKGLPKYLAPPSGRGVYTGITGYWDFQTNGGSLEYLEVSPANPNHVHAMMMVATDSGSTSAIGAARRTAYNFSSDGGETWGSTVRILNKGNIRSGYPQMTIQQFGANYLATIVNHAVHPNPADGENPLATTISLQQGLGSEFGDAIHVTDQFETMQPIWPMVKVSANGNTIVAAGRQAPNGGMYVTTFDGAAFANWEPLDLTVGGARSSMAVSPGGKVAISWFGYPEGASSDAYTIYFRESVDNGLTWGPKDSIAKEPNGYVRWDGFDMCYVGEKLYIVSQGGGFTGTSVTYASARIRIWDNVSRTSRIVIDSVNFPFLAKTMSRSQRGHAFGLSFPAVAPNATGTRLFVLADAFTQGVVDKDGWNYSDIVYTYSDDGGFTWADVRNLTRTNDLDERYVSISNYNPIINDSSWLYFGFQEDRIPGHNIVISDGDGRPVSKNAFKFMRVNTDYKPTKELVIIGTDLVNATGLRAVDVPETVKVIIKNDGLEANPTSVTITFKGGSFPAHENDGVKEVFNPVWGGLGGKYAFLKFNTLFIPKFPARDTTVFVRIFYTGDEDPSTNDGKKTISILPKRDLALSYLTQLNPLIQPKASVTPYIPQITWKAGILNLGGDPSTGANYLLRYSVNNGPVEQISRPPILYAKTDSVTVNFTPPSIGTYDLKVWPTLTGDIYYANDTLSMKLRAHQSNSFAIAYDDSNDAADSNWGVDSAKNDLTTGVRFTAPRRTRLLSADAVFTTSFRDTLADSVVVSVRSAGANDTSSGSILWKKAYIPNTPEGFPYIIRTTGNQWVSFPIDEELWFDAGQDFWITISFYLRPALKTTGRNFPQGTDYYPTPYKIQDPNNRSFFSENYGQTWHPLRENYYWVPPGPTNRIVLRNLVRAICLDTTLSDQISVRAGWNMVSIPVRREDLKTSLFPAAQSNAFTYEGGSYKIKDTLKLGPAYWLKFASAQNFSVFGGFVYETEFPVTTGWNMIGSVIKPTNISAITQEPAGIISSPFYEYGATGYALATQIRPGLGYWIKTNAPGKLKVSATIVAKEEAELADLSKFNSITITDKFKNSQTLYFGENTDGNFPIAYYTLPPSPPAGVLDVRFASQRLVEAYPAQFEGTLQYPISINADAYPITVSWNLSNRTRSFLIESSNEDKKQTISLSGDNGSTQIIRASSIILKIDSKGIPTEFMLGQNYPNPFNPSTKFEFAMPKNARVEVSVYDILGSKVATLFEGMKEAGYHSVEWNGQNSQGHIAPSGVYFIKMTSDGFSAVRKALMLK